VTFVDKIICCLFDQTSDI